YGGRSRVPSGKVNFFQRQNESIDQPLFDESLPATPLMNTTATWGSLASYAPCRGLTTKRIYGCSGNSFIAVIDFGPHRVTARAVRVGGASGHPNSPHFKDQAGRYATGNLRTVYYYPAQLKGHTDRTYHPGEKPAYE
ncbi:MAG: penicillin acylase family protein, partial [Terriglobales bacterium]